MGTYAVAVCTNIACLLGGALELLEHAESTLGVRAGGTTTDGVFTLHEAECLADCDKTPCVQVNHRYVGAQTPESFDTLVEDLRAGRLSDTVPDHGTLVRVRRTVGLQADREPNTDLIPQSLIIRRYFGAEQRAVEKLEADRDAIKSERAAVSQEQAARAAAAAAATATEGEKKA